MSQKVEATYHGADIVTRLRLYANHASDWEVMFEAATEIEKLREKIDGLEFILEGDSHDV